MINNQQLLSLAKRNAKNAKQNANKTEKKDVELTDEFFRKTYRKYFRYGKYRSISHNPNGYSHTHLQIKEWEKYPNHYVAEVVCRNEYGSLYDTGVSYLVPKYGKQLDCESGILIKL